MLGIFYAVITVLAWGTRLAPSQNIPFKNQQIKTFHVAIAVYWQKDPQPKARAATLTLFGWTLAMIGGVVSGNLKRGKRKLISTVSFVPIPGICYYLRCWI